MIFSLWTTNKYQGTKKTKDKILISGESWTQVERRKRLKEMKMNAKSERLRERNSLEYSEVNKQLKKTTRN